MSTEVSIRVIVYDIQLSAASADVFARLPFFHGTETWEEFKGFASIFTGASLRSGWTAQQSAVLCRAKLRGVAATKVFNSSDLSGTSTLAQVLEILRTTFYPHSVQISEAVYALE